MKKRLIAIREWIVAFFKKIVVFFQDLSSEDVGQDFNSSQHIESEPKETVVVNVGDTVKNPEWQWIKVQNPKGRRNGNGFHNFGSNAGIQEGAILTAVALDGNFVLVSYQSPEGQGYGSEAGNGTLFFVPKIIFANMSQKYTLLEKEREKNKARVIELLKQTISESAKLAS